MEINPKPPTRKGPSDTFTGDVWLDAIYVGEEPSSARVNVSVHPRGPHRLALSCSRPDPIRPGGVGLVQKKGDEIVTLTPGTSSAHPLTKSIGTAPP